MRRLIMLLAASGMTLLGLIAVSGPAVGSIPPGLNGKIAFFRDDRGVFTIDPNGTHEQQIDGDVILPSDRAWSPDSSKLLLNEFLKHEGARPATVDPDGSDFALLDRYPNLIQHLGCGFWSPDATRFLCLTIEDADPVNGLYTLRSSDGGGLKRITNLPGCLRGHPCIEDIPRGYSADGSRVLFNRQLRSTHLGHLFVVKPDGTGLLQLTPPGLLTPDSDCCGLPADWSPDGSRVAFGALWKLSTGQGFQSALFVVNADGTGLHRVTPFGVGALSASWSPDGRLIAFNSKARTGVPQIWVVHPDGSGLKELPQPTDGDASFIPEWSPDSTKLLFQSFHPEINGGQEDLWIVNADGTGLLQLTNTPENENTPSWGSAPAG